MEEINQILSGDINTGIQQTISQDISKESGTGGMLNGLTTRSLLIGILVSVFGFAYFHYGKTNGKIVALSCGIIMMIYPYFVYNTLYLIVIFIILGIIPFLIKE